MDVNQCIVKILDQIGVGFVFGGSGQVNASMLLALKKSEKIKTVIVKNEQAASFMACGYAMYSDKLGVCFATGGPGAFNLFSGMAVAYSDSLPVIAITGYASAGIRGKGALNESTGLSRTPDSHKMFSATTKKSFIIENADEVCDIMEEAINIAFEGRPGPVHIHIPKDITMAEVNNFRNINLNVIKVMPEDNEIQEIVKLIEHSIKVNKKIVLLIGYGAIRSHAADELLTLSERYKIPFMTTMDAKGILPENHELSLGVFGTSGDPGAFEYFQNSEVVLAVGNSFAENATFAFKKDLYAEKTLIHINIDPHEINKVYPAEVALISDVKPAITAILQGLRESDISAQKVDVKRNKFCDEKVTYDGEKIHPAELVQMISRNLPEQSIIMGDAGAHMLWLNCYLNLDKGQLYQNPGSFGPMASNVNGAIGVKCANPDRTVVCACGDGDYLMAGFELLTAVEYEVPVVWVIFNNGEFNIIKKFLLNIFGEHAFMEFKNPDYVKYADACGARGYRVEKAEDFESVFIEALNLKKPVIIDVVIEPDVYPPFAMSKV
jgi:acetolactate synthase-1/2/3 large subunit